MPPLRSHSDLGLDSEELDSRLSLCSWGTEDGLADPFGQPSPHHGRWKAGQKAPAGRPAHSRPFASRLALWTIKRLRGA